jgi:hypothetical protein
MIEETNMLFRAEEIAKICKEYDVIMMWSQKYDHY